MASEAKQKLTIWVKPRTAEYICYQAQSKGLTISEAADALLETAFREDAEVSGAELISVALKNEMRREFGGLSNRIANLLARAALEGISAATWPTSSSRTGGARRRRRPRTAPLGTTP